MKYIRNLILLLLLSNQLLNASGISMRLNNADIKDLINVVSKIEGKNILYSDNISFKINFIQNKKFSKDDLKVILVSLLEKHGYSLIDKGSFYEISKIKLNNIKNTTNRLDERIYRIYSFKNLDMNHVVYQIKPLLNKNAKITTLKNENKILIVDTLRKQIEINKLLTQLNKENKLYTEKIKLSEQDSTKIVKLLKDMEKSLNKTKNPKLKTDFFDFGETNTIFVSSKDKSRVKYYIDMIKKMDIKSYETDYIMDIVFLKNASCNNIETILKNLLTNTAKLQKTKKVKKNIKTKKDISTTNIFSKDNDVGEMFITKDETLNAIILKGKKPNVLSVKKIIEKLDIPKKQVYVKATVIEIQDNATKNLGIRYGLEGFDLTDNGLITLGSTLTGPSIASTLFTELAADTEYASKKGISLGFSLDFLKNNGDLEILSEPSILCINNQESTVKVVETIPVLSSTTVQSTGGSVSSYTREDVGITLTVKPQLSNDKKVTLDVSAILEGIVSEGVEVGTPTTTKREVTTTAILKDGESVILGGLIRSDKSDNVSKVPLLGDIPLIGDWLFSSHSTQNKKTSLVIILTPYIIDEDSSLNDLRSKLIKLSYIQKKYNKMMEKEIEEKYTEKKKKPINKLDNIINNKEGY